MKLSLFAAASLAALWTTAACAVPTLDGSLDAEYGAPLSVQNTKTQFGNATNGDPVNGGGGSEIDAVYGKVVGNRLYVLVAGNLETNFNKLELFFDSTAGGVNSIDGAAQPKMVDGYCCKQPNPVNLPNPDSGALQRMHGLTFDAGFNADYYLTITHGFEGNIDGTGTGTDGGTRMYAASAHYARLSDPANSIVGAGQALGMQLAQRGLPQLLRGTSVDFDVDGDVDGIDFLTWQRGFGTTGGATRAQGDAIDPDGVDADDYGLWAAKFGFTAASSPLNDNFFAPQSQGVDKSDSLLGPTLPNLAQGQLIDKAYVAANPGFNAPELQFALAPISPNNTENRRDLLNTVDLRMAIDNSNTEGVEGSGSPPWETAGNPQSVTKGIEFSIPLSQIGNPTGSIKLFAFVNGGDHNYASNQFSGVGILDGNLGGNGTGGSTGDLSGVLMTDFPDDQFVTIANAPSSPASGSVPEPGSLALTLAACLVAHGVVARRHALRRRSPA